MQLKSGTLCAILVSVGLFTMLAVTGFSSQATAAERKITVQPSELPTAIKKAVEEAFPKGQILKIQKEVEGEDPGQYDFDIRADGKEYEVEVSPEGKVIEIKEVGPTSGVPEGEPSKKWTKFFDLKNRKFATTGRNRFFLLQPGYQLVLESRTEKVVVDCQ